MAISDRRLKIDGLYRRLNYKYIRMCQSGDPDLIRRGRLLWTKLDNIHARSFPVVYLDFFAEEGELDRIRSIRHQRKKRANNYLKSLFGMFPDDLFFCTFTWTDSVLDSTSDKTRHRYVQSFLNEHSFDYYANIDFGSKNGREHYHAIVAKLDISAVWSYGFWNFEKIRSTDISRKKLTSYLIKLVNHAFKISSGKPFHRRAPRGGYRDVTDFADNLSLFLNS